MTLYNDPTTRHKLIMDRYKHPVNAGELDVEPIIKFSSQCVDNMKLYIHWEKGKIKDVKHISDGCAVFLASTDIFIDHMIGKAKLELGELVSNYENLINQTGDTNLELLGDLVIFDNVKTHLNRLLCANMISETLKGL